MSTKNTPAKTAAAPAVKKTSSVATKKTATAKKMTKTELVRLMAEKVELPSKQSAAFFDLLASTAIQDIKKNGEFTIPGLASW
jgi:DNA-binding protein HU-beta